MDFQHLNYWLEKAKNTAPETRLFINGEYCAAQNGETFSTVDPFAQRDLAEVARGKKADVDIAVKAARDVFDRGDWAPGFPGQTQSRAQPGWRI